MATFVDGEEADVCEVVWEVSSIGVGAPDLGEDSAVGQGVVHGVVAVEHRLEDPAAGDVVDGGGVVGGLVHLAPFPRVAAILVDQGPRAQAALARRQLEIEGPESMVANERWAQMLSEWAIPQDLIAAAPESPYFFDPVVFTGAADEAVQRPDDTPSDRAAREPLSAGGQVLDVGVGAGAASLRLGAGSVVGVDPNRMLLDAFAERAERLGLDHTQIEGAWPDVATQTPVAEVAVCHHVVYNVADLAAFAQALTDHASARIVIELTTVHPMTWLTPYWRTLHGIAQPERPTADDAVAVLREMGLTVHLERWRRPIQMIGETGDEQVNRIARRLCLGPSRHAELRRLLENIPPPVDRDVVTLWWPGGVVASSDN